MYIYLLIDTTLTVLPLGGMSVMMLSVIKLVQGFGRLEQEQVRTEEQQSSPPVKLWKNSFCSTKMFYRNSFENIYLVKIHLSVCHFLFVCFLLISSDR